MCYGVWVSEQKDIGILSVVTSILVTLLFGVLLIWLVKAIIDAWFGKRDEDTVRPLLRTDGARRYEVLKVGAYILVSRFVVFLLVYLMYTAMHGYKGGILDTLEEIWKRFDSPSYLGIAERWYVTSGDPQYHIVFFPLFPIVIRLFNYITGNTFASAMLVSLLSSVGAGMMLYKLLLIDYSEKISKFTVLLVFIFPAAFFFSAPMTESLFLLISVTCLYFTRKKLYLFAGVFGALAAFTRSQGVLLMVPMGIEAVRELIIMFKTKDKNAWRGLASRLTGIIIVPVGLLMYIWVNYSVWGDAFKFLEIQREHWSQGLSFFFNTVSYQTDLFIRNLDKVNVETAWGLWFSNLAAIFGTLIIVILCGVFCNVDRRDVAAQRTSLYDGGIPCDACTCHNVQKVVKEDNYNSCDCGNVAALYGGIRGGQLSNLVRYGYEKGSFGNRHAERLYIGLFGYARGSRHRTARV